MVNFKVFDSDTGFREFILEGHVFVNYIGENALCAGISVLVQSILLSFKNILNLNVIVERRNGYLRCILPEINDQKNKEFVDLLVLTMINGINDLKLQFPNEIRLEWL